MNFPPVWAISSTYTDLTTKKRVNFLLTLGLLVLFGLLGLLDLLGLLGLLELLGLLGLLGPLRLLGLLGL